MTHPKVLALAREICAQVCGRDALGRQAASEFLAGDADDETDMAIAIAAIERVTEAAANLAEGWVAVDYDESANCMAGNIRDEIAAFDYLPDPEEKAVD